MQIIECEKKMRHRKNYERTQIHTKLPSIATNETIAKFTPIRWSRTTSIVSCTIDHQNNDREMCVSHTIGQSVIEKFMNIQKFKFIRAFSVS